ncbi:netrin receptor unc-5 [Scaptodrosophila lebanonensis]|uniref:Netrin receptor UNC5 n=1 Tax=Drosophila lebanonensis TaxID=7225 RepID=A0A6J2UAZ9_DROLE|nr:netrin receptor unc-5 [Scaptodrosophila lebanonensis]
MSSSSASVINTAGNVIVLIVNLQLIWPLLAKEQLPLPLPLPLTLSLPQADYSGSMSVEDMIDPLTAIAPFASHDVYREDLDLSLNGADQRQRNAVTEDSAPQPQPQRPTQDLASNSSEDATKFRSSEFEGRASGTLLEEFNGGKLNGGEASNTLPIFLSEPESVFVVKNRPAVLKCKASHALQLHFKCSGSSQPPPSTHDKHVDPHTGVHVEEVTATIHRDLVDEYFGKGPFKCECQAWSSRGVVKSQAATVHIAYIRKSFNQSPTSLRIELGSRAELHCESPGGFPEPKVTWHKNNAPITGEGDPTITVAGGTLTFRQVALQDMANYSCSAENVAGRRLSDSAVLIVYVNGGWSAWSPWSECKCAGKPSRQGGQGRKRTRTCTNPMPLNGGSQCVGPHIQKSVDCAACPEDTQIVSADGFDISSSKRIARWSAWSDWSICSAECIQVRRRKCVTNGVAVGGDVADETGELLGVGAAALSGSSSSGAGSSGVGGDGNGSGTLGINVGGTGYGKSLCSGKDIQTAECRGEQCQIGKDDFDWTLYLGLAFITAVCFAFGAALICCARRGIRANPHYNMARSVMDGDYMPGVVDKKEMRMHIEAANCGYDYVNPGHRYLPGEHVHVGGVGVAEHHYDVPNLAANYTNPIDDLSADYLSETGESSTADTSNSTFDMNAKLSLLSASKSTTYELLSSSGGQLRLYGGELLLFVPELAIGKHLKKHVSLMLLSDECSRIACATDSSLLCSSVVHSAPRNYSFVKPVILKIPHCLMAPEQWHVHIYHADSEHDDLNVSWRRAVSVGEETINTPMFVQLEPTHVYIMTEQLGHFAVVAEPRIQQPAIKMKLLAFSQSTPSSLNSSLRIYVVKDFPNSKDLCANVESKLGGTFMGESAPFAFVLNSLNLNIRVRCIDATEPSPLYEHAIPYQHILSNNSILHCEFSIRRQEQQTLCVDFVQSSSAEDLDDFAHMVHTFSIPAQTSQLGASLEELGSTTNTTISIDRQGNYVNESCVMDFVQLPHATKRLICAALDPPRADERDWRLLAKKLSTDRYIAYFATKPSPTEQILNLFECRANNNAVANGSSSSSVSHTVMALLQILKEMGRQDVLDIIVQTIGPLWI